MGSRIAKKVARRIFHGIPGCHESHLIIIYSTGCFTIVPDGRSRLCSERGAEWVRVGLAELPPAQVVFATDYPQAVRDDDEVVAYVKAVSTLGSEAQAVLNGTSAEKLIPNLTERLNRMHIDAEGANEVCKLTFTSRLDLPPVVAPERPNTVTSFRELR